MPVITKVEAVMPEPVKRKRVAAYARVSKGTDQTQHSLSAQVSHYSSLIQGVPDWEYSGVYADDGISGTGTKKREAFRRLLDECEAGKVDIILNKSISRFARNTVDLLETVRHLRDIGVEVRFEKENISTMTGDGELMLTILASFAQTEVEAMSQNIKWSIHCQLVNFPDMSREETLEFLLAAVYEIIDTDNLNTCPDEYVPSTSEYRDAVKLLNNSGIPRFPVKDDFYKALDEIYDPKKPLYRNDFDRFLKDTYGKDPDPFESGRFEW